MAISTNNRDRLDNANPDTQRVSLGTQIYNIQKGTAFDLPTSDPGVAGYLYVDSYTVKVSSGT